MNNWIHPAIKLRWHSLESDTSILFSPRRSAIVEITDAKRNKGAYNLQMHFNRYFQVIL